MQLRPIPRNQFFQFSLSEMLKNVDDETPDSYLEIFNFFASRQLQDLNHMNSTECHRMLSFYYKHDGENFRLLESAVKEDQDNQHPLLFCCYALTVDDINKLGQKRVALAIKWLEHHLPNNPNYAFILNNLLAVHATLSYQENVKIEFPICSEEMPKNTYINLAKANLVHAKFDDGDLSSVNFTGANLTSASLANTELSGVILKNAILDNANLRNTNFHGTILDGSFKNADLSDADLRDAYLHRDSLDLTGVKMHRVKMDERTLFSYQTTRVSDAEHEKYYYEKKLSLRQVEYFDASEFNNVNKVKTMFNDMHEMLKDSVQFPFVQECITHDFICIVTELKDSNAGLAEQLYKLAYAHPLFGPEMQITRAANMVSRSLYSLFSDNAENAADVIESGAQEQIRRVFGH